MTPPLLFLFTLCISYAGGSEDCSFTWEMTQPENPNHAGEFNPDTKTITGIDIPTIIHETKHVLCHLQSQTQKQLNACNQNIDNKGLLKQIKNPEYQSVIPTMIAEKTAEYYRTQHTEFWRQM